MDIGGNLKAIRKYHGLSQRELAKRAGVTNSTISMIEKNSVSPSISSLEKVLSGIPLSLAEFFANAETSVGEPLQIYRAEVLPDIGANGIIRKLVGADHPFRTFSLTDQYFPAGSNQPQHGNTEQETGDGEIAGILISGKLELSVEQNLYTLEAGDAFYIEGECPYQLRNPFDLPCRLICASANTDG